MNVSSLLEVVRSREPYREHTGSFIVNIGNGIDKDKYDWVCITQDNGSGVVLIKHDSTCAAFDKKRFMSRDYSHPLNYKHFNSSEEAYEKLMKWIGKMVKKDDRGRYYTNTRYKDYGYSEDEFDSKELDDIASKLKE